MSVWRHALKGEKGDIGETGPQGIPGAIGPQGPQGPSGISKRIEIATGVTNASGQFLVTFSPAFADVPHVRAEMMPAPNTNTFIRLSAVSASGCTVHVFTRASLSLLGLDLLASATVNAVGVPVSVMAVEK